MMVHYSPSPSPSPSREASALSSDELALAADAMNSGRIQEKRSAPPPEQQDAERNIMYYATLGPVSILRLIPFETDQQALGVLCLRIEHPVARFTSAARLEKERSRPEARAAFFWAYLEQVTSLIERALLRLTAAEHE
jgi:hypothetical protein